MTDNEVATSLSGALDQVIDWLLTKNNDIDTVPRDLDLIESRLLDSLGFMEFILLLEDLMGREIDVDKLSIDQFRTLDAIQANFFTTHDTLE